MYVIVIASVLNLVLSFVQILHTYIYIYIYIHTINIKWGL